MCRLFTVRDRLHDCPFAGDCIAAGENTLHGRLEFLVSCDEAAACMFESFRDIGADQLSNGDDNRICIEGEL